MSDLTERLRDNASEWDISQCPQRQATAIEAADRIEQLEAELRDAANAVEFNDNRLGYVSVQMDRDTWQKWATNHE